MNPETRQRPSPLVVIFVLIGAGLMFAAGSCQKKNPSPAQEVPPPADRVAPTPEATTQTILHRTFALSASATFPLEVPAHAVLPHLHGNYKSYVKQAGIQSSDDTANVDFLLFTQEQYNDFSHGRPGETLFSVDASHDQEVNVSLPAAQDQPRKYYLVFRNRPGEARKLVQADLTLDF